MTKVIACLMFSFLLVGCDQKPGPVRARAEKDPKLVAIEEKIANTTADAKQTIEKVKSMKPEVNGQTAPKTLDEILKEFSEGKGAYNISIIGWEASQKRNGRWKVVAHYQDYQKQYTAAEWEYNPETEKVYPFEFANAPGFWPSGGSDSKPDVRPSSR